MDSFQIANRIKYLRVQKTGDKHGSPKEFANYLGVKYTTYVNYEKGRVTPEFLLLLKEKMGVSTDWLLTGEKVEGVKSHLPPEVEKLITIMEKGKPEDVGYIRGVIDSEYRKVAQARPDQLKKEA